MNRPTSAEAFANLIAQSTELKDSSASSDEARDRELIVDHVNPHETLQELSEILRSSGTIFDRGVPVVVAEDKMTRSLIAVPLTSAALVAKAHALCRPRKPKIDQNGTGLVDARLPKDIATMFLESRPVWNLPPLNGFSSTPLLRDDGQIFIADGYQRDTGLWLASVPDVSQIIPLSPTFGDARVALQRIRTHFRSFCFADAATKLSTSGDAVVVDIDAPVGMDEATAICALLTAIARPSLPTAPALLISGALLSGAGTGKGLLARVLASIAFGREISAFTLGETSQEFEKRLSAELMAGHSVVFLDNVNGKALRSNLLATAITENPARVRRLGSSEMVPMSARSFIVVTGNGLNLGEDLVRRFLPVHLDARSEAPENRIFSDDILARSHKERLALLAAALTIWRWGRVNGNFSRGAPSGSFDIWARWCRDPLLALGLPDPIQRQADMKNQDPERERVRHIFELWQSIHGDQPMSADNLGHRVKEAIRPGRPNRQAIASELLQLAGTTLNGFRLDQLPKTAKWTAHQYRLVDLSVSENIV